MLQTRSELNIMLETTKIQNCARSVFICDFMQQSLVLVPYATS